MQARAATLIAQLPKERRLDAIAEGLELIAEHVATLRDGVRAVADAGEPRGFAALRAGADEEAAKALILVDLVRLGWDDQKLVHRQLTRFNSHLARCIYAEVADMSPATFAEVRKLVDALRVERYLDGPNDVDWIFRNELINTRERQLYVDYVRDESGAYWVSPSTIADVQFGYSTNVLDLVVAMHDVGLFSKNGLEVTAAAWKGVHLQDSTHWKDVEAINRRVLGELGSQSTEAAALVCDRWTFPLGGLELELKEVSKEELEAKRERVLASFSG